MARRLLLVALLALAVVTLALAPAAEARLTPRVVGGAVATPQEAPWTAAIVSTDVDALAGQLCGGTVIAPRVVVTAAHCLDGITERFEVVVGRERLSSKAGERIPVAAIRVNPSFRDYGPRDDVAVLLLARPTRAPVLPLAGRAEAGLSAADATVRVYGWGAVKKRNGPSSDDLRVGVMRALPAAACTRLYPGLFSKAGQLCATGPADGLPDVCSGDSGGPLVAGQGPAARLVGIVSFGGERCGDPKSPGVFTRVADFAPWIARQAGIAPPPGPARPPGLAKVVLRFGQFSCPSTCRVDVRVTGEGAESLTALGVRIRAGTTDRGFFARRVGERKWRVNVGQLPPGRVRVTATGIDDGGRPVGERARVTLAVVG